MNFTREPIIETVITPREGCKLVIRSSKGRDQEDYYVDAVEVVSFGHSFFFRSQERPKSFLVPVSDYEVLELKETRMVLKNITTDRAIKIGGGREMPPRQKEQSSEEVALSDSRPAPEKQQDRKRDKRRRNRRGRDRYEDQQAREPHAPHEASSEELRGPLPPEEHLREDEPVANFGQPPESPEEKAPSFISKLFPPPPTLIKESLNRYKPIEANDEGGFSEESEEKTIFKESIFEHPNQKEKEQEDDNEE